jgi:hypothetical protein
MQRLCSVATIILELAGINGFSTLLKRSIRDERCKRGNKRVCLFDRDVGTNTLVEDRQRVVGETRSPIGIGRTPPS